MKLMIPVDENRLETNVCVSFGRAPWFLLYDTEAKQAEFLENTAAQAEGGAGLKAAQIVVDSGAEALLTVRCGQNAAQVLQAADIRIYRTQGSGVQENLEAFQAGKLELMTKFHAGYHGLR